jgi:hypothetical protein
VPFIVSVWVKYSGVYDGLVTLLMKCLKLDEGLKHVEAVVLTFIFLRPFYKLKVGSNFADKWRSLGRYSSPSWNKAKEFSLGYTLPGALMNKSGPVNVY